MTGHLPAVRHNRKTLEDALYRGGVFGAGEMQVCPRRPRATSRARCTAPVREAEGLLLLYFAGHAVVTYTFTNKLHLQMRTARMVAGQGCPDR